MRALQSKDIKSHFNPTHWVLNRTSWVVFAFQIFQMILKLIIKRLSGEGTAWNSRPHFGVDNFTTPYLSPVFLMEKVETSGVGWLLSKWGLRVHHWQHIFERWTFADGMQHAAPGAWRYACEKRIANYTASSLHLLLLLWMENFHYHPLPVSMKFFSNWIILHIDWYWVVSRHLWTAIIDEFKLD